VGVPRRPSDISPFARAWGDVVSVELAREGRTVFSFQVAHRSAQLDAPLEGVWPGGLGLDSFGDLVAVKMTGFVERGAPRDFRDVHSLCTAGLSSPTLCWSLWKRRQALSGQDADARERESASRLRVWFEEDFIA
jgi:hypothetical protein